MTLTYCDSCTELKNCVKYEIKGELFWHCASCKEGENK
jgi:hypothetical protein